MEGLEKIKTFTFSFTEKNEVLNIEIQKFREEVGSYLKVRMRIS